MGTVSDLLHLQFAGFRIVNYRSFDEEGLHVEQLGKINVFIGKDYSGKSNSIGSGTTA